MRAKSAASHMSGATGRYISSILSSKQNISIKVDCEVPCFDDIPQSVYKSNEQLPDVAVYCNSVLVLIIEVESGSEKKSTIKKLILGLMDYLRWARSRNSFITKVRGFVFPKIDNNMAVVQVTVTF